MRFPISSLDTIPAKLDSQLVFRVCFQYQLSQRCFPHVPVCFGFPISFPDCFLLAFDIQFILFSRGSVAPLFKIVLQWFRSISRPFVQDVHVASLLLGADIRAHARPS
jgi:hypothetical protein